MGPVNSEEKKDTNVFHLNSSKRIILLKVTCPAVNFISITMKDNNPGPSLNQQYFEHLLQQVQASCLGVAAVCDSNGRLFFGHRTIENITGKESISTVPFDLVHPDDVAAFKNIFDSNQSASVHHINIRIQKKDGGYCWLSGTVTPTPAQDSGFLYILHLQDITEQKETEQNLHKAKRLYLFLSQVNQMLVKTTEEEALFKQACEIAVDIGLFRMAWVGLADETGQALQPVTYAGDERGYLSKIKINTSGKIPEGRGPSGRAFRSENYFVCNDIANAPEMAPWRDEALERKYRSSISLPIRKMGKVVGTYTLYADTPGFFDTAEIDLLEECTGDISFALDNIEKDKLRRKTEEALAESEKRYHVLTEISPVGIFHTDATGYTTYVNPRWCQIAGMSYEAALGNGWFNAVYPADRQQLTDGWKKAVDKHNISFSEYRFLRPDGTIAWVLGMAVPEVNAAGEIIGYAGTTTDITERIVAEQEILKEKNLSDTLINALPGIFYLASEEKGLMRWNKNFAQISGYTAAELKGKRQFDFIEESERESAAGIIKEIYEKGEGYLQANFCTKDGRSIPYYFTGIAVEYDGQQCLAGVGIDFTERIEAQNIIKNTTEQLRHLAAHLQSIREDERKRIGQEIHDDLGQLLTAIKMDVVWIDKKLPADAAMLKAKTANILTLLDAGHLSVRQILNELKPGALDDRDLSTAIAWLNQQFTQNTEIPVEFTCNTSSFTFSESAAICLFRIYQEALTNIMRYAEPTMVTTGLLIEDNTIKLQVSDNGHGFDTAVLTTKKSFGILGMRERALSLGGYLDLVSAPGKGTSITVTIPAPNLQ